MSKIALEQHASMLETHAACLLAAIRYGVYHFGVDMSAISTPHNFGSSMLANVSCGHPAALLACTAAQTAASHCPAAAASAARFQTAPLQASCPCATATSTPGMSVQLPTATPAARVRQAPQQNIRHASVLCCINAQPHLQAVKRSQSRQIGMQQTAEHTEPHKPMQ